MNLEIDSYELKNIFDLLDYDKDGKVNLNEAIELIKSIDYDKENPVIFNFIQELGEGLINYDDFEKKINQLIKDQNENNGLRRMYEIFINDNKNKNINLNEFQKICNELGRNLSNIDLENLFKEAGNEKEITFETFVDFLNKKFGK
jgi:Ca2+-binding EF-hand superfamily protein